MTKEERRLCLDLRIIGTRSRISKKKFQNKFPAAVRDGKLSADLLADAYRRRDPLDLELALLVGFNFGFGNEHLPVLCQLIDEDWHVAHESAVSALDEIRNPSAVDFLFRAAERVPEYLAFDDARALAVKAIWALGNLGTESAIKKLEALAVAEAPVIRRAAAEQLERQRRDKAV